MIALLDECLLNFILIVNNGIPPEYVYFKKLDWEYKKEAGKYLVYTSYSDGTNINTIYNTIFNYIKEQHLQILGNIYEDYPLSGIFASDESLHFIRIMIPIK